MPFVILCGFPSSGKTHRAHQLKTRIQASFSDIHVINNEALGLKPRQSYSNSTEEKKARASFMAACSRLLNSQNVVIADSLNYTKSERYQMYCLARELKTTHCIVHCATSFEQCQALNANRTNDEEKLSEDLFLEMTRRFEEPRDSQRWDNPLFTVQFDDESMPVEAIVAAISKKQVLSATLATATSTPSQSDYLYNLDKSAQAVITVILQDQKSGVSFSENVEFVSMAELARHKRQFLHIHSKMRTSNTADLLATVKMQEAFRDYLRISLVSNSR